MTPIESVGFVHNTLTSSFVGSPAAGESIIVCCTGLDLNAATFYDNQGGTTTDYVLMKSVYDAGSGRFAGIYCRSNISAPSGTFTVSLTPNGGISEINFALLRVSGLVVTSPRDSQGDGQLTSLTAWGAGGSHTVTGTGTLTQADQIAISAISGRATAGTAFAPTTPTGYTSIGNRVGAVAYADSPAGAAYKVLSATTTPTAPWTSPSAGNDRTDGVAVMVTLMGNNTPPPVLSGPGRDNITATGVRITGTSDVGSGTFYVAASTSATPPTAAQIKAGSGGSIVAAGSASLAAGANAATISSGLSPTTTYYGYAVANNGNDSNVIATTSFTTTALAPVVTGVSDLTPQEGDALTITSAGGGTGFNVTQGSVTIGGASATVTAWSDTSVTATVPIGTNAYGASVNVVVTNVVTGLSSAGYALTSISPPTGYAAVTLTSINADPDALLLEAVPDLAIGDQIEHETVGGLVTVNPDATVTWDPSATEFDVRARSDSDGWGDWATITLSSGAANSAPTGTDASFTITEDGTAKTFATADFGYSDADSDPIQAVRIDTLPLVGALTLSGSAVTTGQVIPVANIGNLVFTPAANGNGSPYATFTFSVQDDQNNYDATPNTITINVTAVNDAPAGTNGSATINEDTAHTFAASEFGFTDVDSGDTISAVRIDTLPLVGALTLSGSAVAAGQVIVAASIGNLVFTPAANGNGSPYATFTFSVRDQSSVFDAAPNTFTVNVTAVNDAPTVANAIANQTATEDAAFSFQFAADVFSDVEGDTLTYTAPTIPAWLTFTAGTRTFSGTPATGDIGVHNVVVRATDPSTAFVEDTFTVTVSAASASTVSLSQKIDGVLVPVTLSQRQNGVLVPVTIGVKSGGVIVT